MKITRRKMPIPGKDPGFVLGSFLELGLVAHASAVGEVIKRAEREARQEDTLDRIQHTWQHQELASMSYEETGVDLLALGGDEERSLENDILSLGTMLQASLGASSDASAAIAFDFHRKRGLELQETLVHLSSLLQNLARVQGLWTSLLHVFDAEEVRQDLSLDSKTFREADSSFRFLVGRLQKMRYALKIARETGIGAKLSALTEKLEGCKRAVWCVTLPQC